MANSAPKRTRPVSPNIQIYRPQLTSVLSIANRVAGVTLSIYAVALVVWLIAAAAGPQAYSTVHAFMRSWAGQVLLFGGTFSFFPAPLRRHPASGLGCGLRFRASYDLRIRMDGGDGKRGAHDGHLDRQHSLGRVNPMNRERMRSPLGRALGLGSAKSGVEQWWLERVTAMALIPLTVWFAVSIVVYMGSDYVTLMAWLRTPIATILMVLLLIGLFYHTALGLQVVVEDYVHSGMKLPALLGMRFGCFTLAVAGILATLRIAFGN